MANRQVTSNYQYITPVLLNNQNQQYTVPNTQQQAIEAQQEDLFESKEQEKRIKLFFFLGILFSPIWIVQFFLYTFSPELRLKVWGLRAFCFFLIQTTLTFVVLSWVFQYERCMGNK